MTERPDRQLIALAALLCVIVVPFVPLGTIVVYPLSLLVTSLHEMGHALAALLTGGRVHSILIYPDTSGVTWSSGGIRWIVASAGYLGSTFFGFVLLIAAQNGRMHRWILGLLLIWFLGFTIFFARNWLAITLGIAMVVGVSILAKRVQAAGGAMYFLLDFVALSSCLYAIKDLADLTRFSFGMATASGKTDAQTLADLTGVHAAVWAFGWALLSLVAAWLATRMAWRSADGTE